MTRYEVTIKTTGRRPWWYTDCTCGFTGSTFCNRKDAAREWERHLLFHHSHPQH